MKDMNITASFNGPCTPTKAKLWHKTDTKASRGRKEGVLCFTEMS